MSLPIASAKVQLPKNAIRNANPISDEKQVDTIVKKVLFSTPMKVDKGILSQISQLILPKQRSRSKTYDPAAFLKTFGIERLNDKLKMTPDDIKNLYRIAENHHISEGLSWHDIFGLEFD